MGLGYRFLGANGADGPQTVMFVCAAAVLLSPPNCSPSNSAVLKRSEERGHRWIKFDGVLVFMQ